MIRRGRAVRVLVALVLATPLAAQEPATPDTASHGAMASAMRCPMMGGMMGNGMRGDRMSSDSMATGNRVMAFSPASLLSREEILGLSAQQESRLTALREIGRAHV